MSRPERHAVAVRPPLVAHAADRFATHDRADFAQEFLRRSPAYRAAWTAARDGDAHRFGLVRLFDPEASVRLAPAIWRPTCASQIVALAPAPVGFAGAAALPDAAVVAEHLADGVRHLVLDCGGVRHRLRVLPDARHAPLAILLPPLGDPLRTAACDAARRMVAGLSVAEPAAVMRPSRLQQRRLALLLRVLDAWQAGASNREIGLSLVYPWLGEIDAVAWKSTSERRRVQRLVAEARALAAGGYRALLRG